MKLIIGLGNPGTKYEKTRHNAGFLAIDFFLKDRQAITCQSKFQAQICEYHIDGQKYLFVKPTSFMNLSGQVVSKLVQFYNLNFSNDILVIHDEIDLPIGKIKSTEGSTAAGHNGVQNIIDELGKKNFHRIRIGIESRQDKNIPPTEAFVLQKFTEQEILELEEQVFPEVIHRIEKFLQK